MQPVEVQKGEGPIVLGLPHTGVFVPEEIAADFNEAGLALADTDWNVHELYDGLLADATTVRATFHRYVIDANRDPGGASLYPGQNTTGLCPLTNFGGAPIYKTGRAPDAAEIERRRRAYHAPYHEALSAALQRVCEKYGVAILYDCHSIRSRIPFLFEGVLPDFNIGTNNGATCDTRIETVVAEICHSAEGYTSVVNGRFRGGWTTRRYGDPRGGVHAIQMELAQSTYMLEEAPWSLDPARAEAVRVILGRVLRALEAVACDLKQANEEK